MRAACWILVASNLNLLVFCGEQKVVLLYDESQHNQDQFGVETKIAEKVEDSNHDNGESPIEPISFRLPNNSIPLRYNLHIRTDIDKGIFNFFGLVKIKIKILTQTNVITLNQKISKIHQIDLLNEDGKKVKTFLKFLVDEKFEFLKVFLPSKVDTNDVIILKISYSGVLRADRKGFYKSSYKNDENVTVWYATTHAQHIDARHILPCYDEPGFKAVFSVSIMHSSDYHAISNMPIISHRETNGKDYVVSRFQDTPRMPSYLLAFVVSDFPHISQYINGIEHRVFASKEDLTAMNATLFLEIAGKIVEKLESFLKVPFPVKKLDHVFLDHQTAMENYGLIIYSQSKLENSKNIISKSLIETMAHEIGHQYFGNLVTPSWWSYTWLSEGFASFFDHFIPSLIWPEDEYWIEDFFNIKNEVFHYDTEENEAKALNFKPSRNEEIFSKFDLISYEKGSCLIKMLREVMTQSTFVKSLRYFLINNPFGSVDPESFHKSVQKAYDEDFLDLKLNFSEFLSPWEEQTGYPTIEVTKTDGKFILKQKNFEKLFPIPISYATKLIPDFSSTKVRILMENQTIEIADESDWIIINVGLGGYYKVNYDPNIEESIIKSLKKDYQVLPPVHRAQLLRDMKYSLDNDSLSVKNLLDMINLLDNESHLMVWNQFIPINEILSKKLFGSSLMVVYQELVQKITSTRLQKLDKMSKDLIEKVSEISCKSLNEKCLESHLKNLAMFIQGGKEEFNLCHALRLANQTIHTIIIKRLFSETDETKRFKMIQDLGCSLNQGILDNFLYLTLNPKINLTIGEKINIIA